MVRASVTALALLLLALPASAQQLSLEIRDGLVTLQATNVTVRQVLAEWAKVGGTKVVGGDRLAGPPLTLSLENVPEGKALDIVLRGAAGYMAAARCVPGSGRSGYDRILVLATSTPPAGGGPAAGAGNRPATRAFGVPPAVEPPDTADIGVGNPEPAAEMPQVNPFANAFGQPGAAQPFGQPPANPFSKPIPQIRSGSRCRRIPSASRCSRRPARDCSRRWRRRRSPTSASSVRPRRASSSSRPASPACVPAPRLTAHDGRPQSLPLGQCKRHWKRSIDAHLAPRQPSA